MQPGMEAHTWNPSIQSPVLATQGDLVETMGGYGQWLYQAVIEILDSEAEERGSTEDEHVFGYQSHKGCMKG